MVLTFLLLISVMTRTFCLYMKNIYFATYLYYNLSVVDNEAREYNQPAIELQRIEMKRGEKEASYTKSKQHSHRR